MDNTQPQTSTSQNPDLDWSQVRETIRMMNLAVAQIEMSMKDGEDSVGTLTHAFTNMMEKVGKIEQQIRDSNQDASVTAPIIENCEAIATDMQHTIIAFQFYDKLTQRLTHVSETLGALSDLVGDSSRLYNPSQWLQLQESIKSKYTMPAEHAMFEMIMSGMSIEQILMAGTVHQEESSDDIELF
jgi:hypothetical protein